MTWIVRGQYSSEAEKPDFYIGPFRTAEAASDRAENDAYGMFGSRSPFGGVTYTVHYLEEPAPPGWVGRLVARLRRFIYCGPYWDNSLVIPSDSWSPLE